MLTGATYNCSIYDLLGKKYGYRGELSFRTAGVMVTVIFWATVALNRHRF